MGKSQENLKRTGLEVGGNWHEKKLQLLINQVFFFVFKFLVLHVIDKALAPITFTRPSLHFLHISDRGDQETAEQGSERAHQQDAARSAECGNIAEGGVPEADAGRRTHAGPGLQKPAGCRGPGSGQGQPGQTQTQLTRGRRRRFELIEENSFLIGTVSSSWDMWRSFYSSFVRTHILWN